MYVNECNHIFCSNISEWTAGSGEEIEKKGDKPPKGGKGRKGPKPKKNRENPDFEDVAGYEGAGFGMDSKYCKFGNFREDFIFAKLRICEVS